MSETKTIDEKVARELITKTITKSINKQKKSSLQLTPKEIDYAVNELLPAWEKIDKKNANRTSTDTIPYGLPFSYVIRDEDLELTKIVVSFLTSFAGVNFFLPQLGFQGSQGGTVSAITGAVFALLKLVSNFKYAVQLDEFDYAIILLLRATKPDGLLVEMLVDKLKVTFPDISSAKIVEDHLTRLTNCVNINGEKTTLVWKDERSFWRTNGV